MISISSEQNEHFKRWKTLDTSKGIRKAGEFILMGEKLIEEFLAARESQAGPLARFDLRAELLPEGPRPRTALRPDRPRHQICTLPPRLFDALDVLGTGSGLLVLGLPEIPALEFEQGPQGLEVVCPVGDPGNLGAVVRSAVAFGVSQMILTEEASLPFHPKALKASAGAALAANFRKGPALRQWKAGPNEWALDMQGEPLRTFARPRNLRLLLGEEGPGLPANLGAPRLSINTTGVESLNVAVAAGIALYELSRKTPSANG